MEKTTRKLGFNRGSLRLWLERQILSTAGFRKGDRWSLIETQEVIGDNGYPMLLIKADPQGARKIAGTPERPIVDINSNFLLAPFGNAGDLVEITNPTAGQLNIKRVSK